MESEESGDWYTDPFERHEARWMSSGTPTSRVRDGRIQSFDLVSDEPSAADPVRIEYVEQRPSAETAGFLKSNGGIDVPEGVVTIESHRNASGEVSGAKMLFQATTSMGALSMQRDIVVWDESHEQELYRDGPYDSITVSRPLERLVEELNRDGVHAFISQRGGGESRTISVTRETSSQIYEEAAITGIEYYWEKLVRIFKHGK